jgi:glycolate oxidase
VITELTLRLLPAQPLQSTVVASFATLTAATEAILGITGTLRPSMLEFMDAVAINAVEDEMRMGLDRKAAGLLVARSDAPGEFARHEAEIMVAACEKAGATEVFHTEDPEEGEAFTAARRFAIPAVEKLGSLLLEDVGVPLPRLGDLITGVAEIAERNGVTVSVIAHAGDGNTHPLIVHDPTDAAMTERAHHAFSQIMDLAIALGGTITGEHGVGRLKKAWLPDQLGPDVMALTQRIKDALDPHGILNPGAVL